MENDGNDGKNLQCTNSISWFHWYYQFKNANKKIWGYIFMLRLFLCKGTENKRELYVWPVWLARVIEIDLSINENQTTGRSLFRRGD